MKKIFLLLLLFSTFFYSQTQEEKNTIISKTNVFALNSISIKSNFEFEENKKRAQELAKKNGWPLFLIEDKIYSELIGVTIDLRPIYYSTYNNGAGITSRANKLYTGGSLGLNINGENMTAAVWDAGSGMPSHQLFSGRLELMDNSPSTHYHSAHVAGTIIGSELFQNGEAKGMAYKGNCKSYDWNSDISEIASAAANGLLISNHSYGRNPYGLQTNEWGKYDLQAQSLDEIMFNAPYYQFVCAAGNSRIYGVNTIKNGYDLLSGHATSKNGITVAAVNELLNYTGANSVVMSEFSSWGSTDDGRIKPDISAKGVDTFSASDTSTSAYDTLSGTSMASPSVAGTLLLYQQYYNQLNASFMKAATLKALMIHTADEAGTTPGPDYKFGWGLINAEKAADVITKNQLQSFILENTLNQNGTFSLSVNALGTEPLVATLCWTDPEGIIPSATNDDATPNLINNLDLRINQNSSVHLPWKLDGANVTSPATQGDNNIDNVEKVEITNPSGNYTIVVNSKGNLLNNLQNYSLIISGVTARDFWITSTESTKNICQGLNSLAYNFNLHTKVDFTETVTYSTLNLPLGITATFSPNPMTVAGSFEMTLSELNSLTPGNYTFIIKGQTQTDAFEIEVKLNILSPTISLTTLNQPINNANSVELNSTLNWALDLNAQEYDIQIASDSNFTNILEEDTVEQNVFDSSILVSNTTYYWRVRAKNICSIGEYSAPFSFTTVCVNPSNVFQTAASSSSATIGWTENSGATTWEVEIVPTGVTPSGIGIQITSNPYVATVLSSNTCYDFYVRSNCGTGTSGWSIPFNFCTQPNYCDGDHFYDTGGASGSYQNGENYTKVIYPENAGDRIRAVFNSFQTEGGYDYLYIYNGPDINSPLLFSGSGTTSPGTKISTHPTGALTFKFTTDSSVTASGWDATIFCEPLPACPVEPTNFVQFSASTNTASIGWTENSGSTSWEVEIVPIQSSPTGTGTVVTTNPFLIEDLTTNTCYKIYVRSICADGFSNWSMPFNFCTQPNYCAGDHFYDTGGANGSYQDNQNITTVIYPENAGDRITALFNYIQFETCCDYIRVYNGTTVNAPLLYSGNGTVMPNLLKSTDVSGALTFFFHSDSSVVYPGWDATITCEPMPPCPAEPSNILASAITTTSATISWIENSGSSSWEVEIVPQGTPPTGNGTTISNNPHTINNLTSNTWYDFYVRSNCSLGQSSWSLAYTFNTLANYCAGDHFYDTGGPNANYPNNQYKTTTIYPDNTGDRIKAIFNSFEVENYYDYFSVYNGPNSNYPLLYSNNGTALPGILASTDITGALTFVFNSGSYNSFSGWDATIICEDLPACPNKPTYVNLYNTTTLTALIGWSENSNATLWEIEIVPQGAPPTGLGTTITENPYTLENLTSNTWYDFYVRSVCTDGYSDWSTVITFHTVADYCGGDHFYDSNGPNANYPDYEYSSSVIYPENAGDRVRAIFNSFSIEPYNDQFTIYNGPNSNYPILFSSNGTNTPTEIASTDVSGALYFIFYSNGNSNTYSGWDATIICEPLPPCSNAPANLTFISSTSSTAQISWIDNSNATSWEVEIVPFGNPPSGTGTITSSNPFTAIGLNSNTNYTVYVRSICGSDLSPWSTSLSFYTQGNYCAGDHFYDTGGASGNYQNNQNITTVIYPENAGDRVTALFNYIQFETCCDYLRVYNGTTVNAPLLYSGNGTVMPNLLKSTDVSGALTFFFHSDSSVTYNGWDATITCEPMPPCPEEPSNITATAITTTAATISWIENSGSSSWEVEIVPQGTTPTGNGTTVSTNPYTINDLTSNTWYDFYVRSNCSLGQSSWSIAYTFNTLANYCAGDHFYDTGGPNANYPNNQYKTTTIYPDNTGDRIKAIFNSFQVETYYDYFSVYNGPSTNYPLLYSNNGTALPSILASTDITGALTFVFNSGTYNNFSGWDATIICEPLPACSFQPTAINTTNITTTTATINWTENSNSTSWEIEIVPLGATPIGSGIVTNSIPYSITDLSTNTCYSIYIRSICSGGYSEWSTYSFCTQPNYCGGDHFYDTGGASGSYQDYENYTTTIYPEIAGNFVQAIFNSFQTESGYDYLRIYNGPTINSPLLVNATGSSSPGTVTSTDISGALTFTFHSDGSVIYSGWDATINCVNLSTSNNDILNSLEYYPNPVTNILNIKSKKPISNYQIFDINMRNISSEKIDKSEFEIELVRFSSGVYFFKLYDSDGNSKEIKVIKE